MIHFLLRAASLLVAAVLAAGVTYAAMSAHAQDAATLTSRDEAVLARIDGATADQLAFLARTVDINSGTLNLDGVKAVGDVYRAVFEDMGFSVRWIDMPEGFDRAGHLVATREFSADGPHILLMGHMDTVFEIGSPFQKFIDTGSRVRGPGIGDMKGGNAVIIFALKALIAEQAIGGGTVTVFLTGDEETPGRPLDIARGDLISAAKKADIALNFEGGSAEWAVIGRRGSSGWTLTVSGRRAHSSGIFSDDVGAGAIFEAARILNRFYGEVRGPFGLTFNPGVIAGGTFVDEGITPLHLGAYGKTNVVAQTLTVKGGLRFMREEQKQAARDAMQKIVDANLPHTEAKIVFSDGYPAMEVTPEGEALLDALNAVHDRLGIAHAKPFPPEKRGAADVSFVAPHVVSMDGLGVDGRFAHSPREDMDSASLVFATQRSALFIMDLMDR